MQNAEFIKDFVEEAFGHAESVESGLLKLENGGGDADIIHGIFRNVHSIKGTAGFFGLKNIVSLSHAMENLFGKIRNGNLVINNDMIDVLISANDILKSMISDVESSEQQSIAEHLEKISATMDSCGEEKQPLEECPEWVPAVEKEIEMTSFADNVRIILLDALRPGQRLCKIKVASDINLVDFFEKIKSIGQIVGVYARGGMVSEFVETAYLGTSSDLLITTVLEKNLVALALDLPMENVIELNEVDLFQAISHPSPGVTTRENTTNLPPIPDQADLEAASVDVVVPVKAPLGEAVGTKKRGNSDTGDTIRVQVSLLNDLLNLASEMVLGRNRLLRILEVYRKEIPNLNTVLQNIDSITTELQERIMQTRMQPLAKIFNKFPRILRELSHKMGKDIKLQMEGIEVGLDKSIIEALGDPLTHLIRNAVDHGIEKPEIRERKGKPKTGTIRLNAYHEGGLVNIDITDDGAGIDVEIVKAKALEKGLITPAEVSEIGERELLGLLFRPGFSTAEKVTDVSGRGVGMDVVKTNIEKLGGTMEIMNNLGHGTTFRLILPLTLAIISSLIVEVEGQKFALPQVNLQEMVRVKPGDPWRRIERFRGAEVLRLRGKLLPLVLLADVLGLRKTPLNTEKVVRILVIKSGSKRFGLVVDLIHDGEEILVKPMPRSLSDCRSYAGVTIMGDGRTAMILDPEGIAVKAGLRFSEDRDESEAVGDNLDNERMTERQILLLFKCSGHETFSIDLSMVARVEKIQAGQIERIGDKEFIQFRGESLRVIRPEHYLPVSRGKKKRDLLYVIIPKLVNYPMGILIEKIHDTLETKITFNRDDIQIKGLVGSAILDNQIVLIVNIYELFELASPENYRSIVEKRTSEEQKTLLLVEDTPFFLKLEKKYLESADYRVLTATNGKEAWKMLQEQRVDAVISDIEMPVMDGFELVKRIRADKRLAPLPVIAVTSKTDDESIQRGMEVGFDFYEIKLDKEQLLEKVRLAFQKRGDAT